MPCPHNEISIVQRSHRQSAVAAAAYQSGEKLFCEYDQEVKHYPEKRGIHLHQKVLEVAEGPFATPKQMDTNPPGSKMAAKAFENYALRGTWKTLCVP